MMESRVPQFRWRVGLQPAGGLACGKAFQKVDENSRIERLFKYCECRVRGGGLREDVIACHAGDKYDCAVGHNPLDKDSSVDAGHFSHAYVGYEGVGF